MTNFKKGDRVRRIKGEHHGHKVGDTGTVRHDVTVGTGLVLEETPGMTHAAYNFELVKVAPVVTEFRVGDRVKHQNGGEYIVVALHPIKRGYFGTLRSVSSGVEYGGSTGYDQSRYTLVGRTEKCPEPPKPTQDELNAAWVSEYLFRAEGVSLRGVVDCLHTLGFSTKDVAAGFALYVKR